MKPDADSDKVEKAYKRRIFEAKAQKDEAIIEALDRAHGIILMHQLKARAGGKVDSSVAYADRN